MWPGRACAVLVAVVLGAAAAPAEADVICVDPGDPECVTAQEAFAIARDGDRILLRAVEVDAPLASAERIEVAGAGEGETILGALELSHAEAAVADLQAASLDLAGVATRLRVSGEVLLRGTAALQAAQVDGTVALAGVDADARLDSVLLRADGGVALGACHGTLRARHVTITGSGDGAAEACPDGLLELRDAIVAGEFTAPLEGAVQGDAFLGGPALVDAAGRLPAGSPLIDAGSSAALAGDEWPEDRDRLPRVADGDGNGVAGRDPGAFEHQPAAVPLPTGNLLLDPGAETGGAWAFANGFTRERYGTFAMPSLPAGAALGGGGAFFAGGPAATGAATQRVDVGGAGLEIDRGTATATLSGLLGGYRGDADAGALEATFLDPVGAPIGTVALATPSAAERRNVTTLLPRGRTDAVPPLTRAIDVTMRATRADGDYDDAYFDNVALTLVAPGAPAPPPPPGPGAPPLQPFAGVRSITGLAVVDRSRKQVVLRLVCHDATVGRCNAVLTLTTRVTKGGLRITAGTAEAGIRPGGIRRVAIRLNGRARRVVRERRRVRMLIYASARDGQGLTRSSTIPLTVQWPKAPRTPKRPRR
jgi:hypothetical protein